jgi:formylglycine-generating enzyme required for sulfatase activity
MYGTNDFCVMKYEAKAIAISNPTVGLTTPNTGFNTIANDTTATTSADGRTVASVASGFPIARISQITAASYCTTAGASLISNAEWMTIARNIEAQGVNWTGGTVGSGGLWRGHSDNSPAGALEASTDNDPYFGTGNTSPSIERRTHKLSNGETIWDLSGNVWEWTSDTISGLNRPNTNSGGLYQEWTTIINFGSLSYDLTRPSNTDWNSTQNMGQYYAGDVTGTILSGLVRGGRFAADGGIYAMFLANQPTNVTNSFGFRCVVR